MTRSSRIGAASAQPLKIRAGHVPGIADTELQWQALSFSAHGQAVEVNLPRLSPDQLHTVANTVRAAACQHLATLPVMDIVAVIDRCIARMLDAHDPIRQEFAPLLAIVSGFDAEMTRLGINSGLKGFRSPQLLRFLVEDLGDPGLLDDFRPRAKGGWTHACGPELLAHVWAGNVPGLPWWSLVSGLLVKAGNIGKVASAEPLCATWFARVLAEVAPQLADTLAVVWWPGGDTAMESVFCQEAEVLKVYGGDPAITAWQSVLPAGKRLLPHGHKLSLGMVSATALDARQSQITARQAALDMMRWDQQGCYSPQLFYVERGGQVSPAEFARHLAGELAALQHSFPRRTLSLEEASAVAQWRQAWSMAELKGEAVELLGPADAPWGLAYTDTPRPPTPGALYRTACVMAVDGLDDALPLVARQRRYLQTVGIAASPEALFQLAPKIARTGVTRLCALGAMAQPAPAWHHDGRFSLLDLVRMVDMEDSAETTAQALATYRD